MLIKSWYRKRVHKQARELYKVTKEHADILLQLYGVHNILVNNNLEPEEFYEAVNEQVSEEAKQRENFERHSNLLKKAFKIGCRRHEYVEAVKEILDHADYEAELSVLIKSPEL